MAWLRHFPLLMISLWAAFLVIPITQASAAESTVVPQLGHSSSINAIAFSPDGRMVLSGSGDHSVKLWDAATGRLIRTFRGHSDDATAVAFGPDGRTVLSASTDKTIKLWEIVTGGLIRTFTGHSASVWSIALSPDGQTMLSGSEDKTIKLWDIGTGEVVRTFKGHSDLVRSVAFSPDGRSLLSGSDDKTIRLWDLKTGTLVGTLKGHSNGVKAVVPTRDGRSVLTGSDDNTLKLWDLETGHVVRTFKGHLDHVTCVAIAPDGRTALSGSYDETIKLWDLNSGAMIHSFNTRVGILDSVAFSPDGQTLLAGGDGKLTLWNLSSKKPVRSFQGYSKPVDTIAIAPDGRTALGGGQDNTLKLWDLASGRLLRTYKGHSDGVNSVSFSPDGERAFSGSYDNTVKVWDVTTGVMLRNIKLDDSSVPPVVSPDGLTALAISNFSDLSLWDVTTAHRIRSFQRQLVSLQSVVFSPDGRRALSAGDDKTVKLWDVSTGRVLRTFKGHTDSVRAVVFSPDGQTALSGSGDNTIKLWDLTNGTLIRTFERQPEAARTIVFSYDGRTALTGGDGTIKFWDVATGNLLRTIDGHANHIDSIVLSPDGRQFLSSGDDGTVRVWNTASGQLLATLISSAEGEWLALTPEGFFDASPHGAELLNIVRGLDVFSVDQFYQVLHRPDLLREKLAGDPQGRVKAAAAHLDLNTIMVSGGAPRVAITVPGEATATADAQVTVEAKVTDGGGGIGRVEWRVNGTVLGVETRGLGPNDSQALRRSVTLAPGENTIEVVAYNARNLIASEPARLIITSTVANISKPRLYVLAIGVNAYWDSRIALTYAAPDATSIAQALTKAGSGLYESVETTTLLDAEATKAKINAAFASLARKIQPQDVFVFFFAGHGKTVDARFYALPQEVQYDGTDSIVRQGISQDQLQSWLATILARKSILLFDSCESGSLTVETGTRGLTVVEEQWTALDRLTQATGRTIMTATAAEKPAIEGYQNHGVFTYALLDGIGRAPARANGLIYLNELVSFVEEDVPNLSFAAFKLRQVPQAKMIGTNFPLVTRTSVLTDIPPAAAAAIPTASALPTHVVIAPLDVREAAKNDGTLVTQLTPGSQVTLLREEQGWSLVARDGRQIGYVKTESLAKLH